MDERNRVAVPSKFMPAMRALSEVEDNDPLEVYLAITMNQTLGIYPRPVFEEILEMYESAPAEDLAAQTILQNLYNHMEEATLDKQNRVRILPMYAERFGLSGTVVVKGSGKFLEVVSTKDWEHQLTGFMSTYRDEAERSMALRRGRPEENGRGA